MNNFPIDRSDMAINDQIREVGLRVAVYACSIGGLMTLFSHSSGTLCRAPSTNMYLLGWGLATLMIGVGLAACCYLMGKEEESFSQYAH